MTLNRQNIGSVMQRLISKLEVLTTPLVDGEPLTNLELAASARLMEWMSTELEWLLEHNRQELGMHRRLWPNYVEWGDFIRMLPAAEANDNDNDDDNDDDDAKKARERRQERIGDFNKQRVVLIAEARQMQSIAPGAESPTKAKQGTFLPFASQREVYRQGVLDYYHQHIENLNIPHKDLMVVYAAMYQAIAVRTGLVKHDFLGPEFDKFLYDYCGINYNASSTPRGRYRQVADVRSACLTDDSAKQATPERRQLFFDSLREIGCYLPSTEIKQGAFTGVPERSLTPNPSPKGEGNT